MFKYLALLFSYRPWDGCRHRWPTSSPIGSDGHLLPASRSLRNTVQHNLRQVMGPDATPEEVRAASKKVIRNVTRYYADLVRVPRLNIPRFIEERLTLYGLDYLTDAIASKKGVIIVSAHYGNPELILQAARTLGIQRPWHHRAAATAALLDFVHQLRASQGQIFLPVSLSTVREAIRWLREGKVVSILCDRDIQNTGMVLPFFGAETRLPVGAAELALRTGATGDTDVLPPNEGGPLRRLRRAAAGDDDHG